MAISLKHAFTSAKADSGDATLVQPSNWNAEHDLTGTGGALMGFDGESGEASEVTVGSGLTLSAGTLSASGGGLPLQLPIQDGRYYIGPGVDLGSQDLLSEVDATLFAFPFTAAEAKTWTRIGMHCLVTGASDEARVGIYADSDGVPGTLVLDAGELALSSTGFIEATISQALSANTAYWLAGFGNAVTGTAEVMFGNASALSGFSYGLQNDGAGNLSRRVFPYRALAYGALPDPFGSLTGFLDLFPLIWLRTGV